MSVVPESSVTTMAPSVATSSEANGETLGGGDTVAMSAPHDNVNDGEAEGLDELEEAFATESVVEGE
jgi:hypothetical protein